MLLGWALVLVAFAFLVRDLIGLFGDQTHRALTTGQFWFELHAPSLNLLQAALERYISTYLWDPVMTTILHWPIWVVIAVPGVLLVLFSRQRG